MQFRTILLIACALVSVACLAPRVLAQDTVITGQVGNRVFFTYDGEQGFYDLPVAEGNNNNKRDGADVQAQQASVATAAAEQGETGTFGNMLIDLLKHGTNIGSRL